MAKGIEKTSWQIVRDALDMAASGNTDPDRMAEIAEEALKEMQSLVNVGDADKGGAWARPDDESGESPCIYCDVMRDTHTCEATIDVPPAIWDGGPDVILDFIEKAGWAGGPVEPNKKSGNWTYTCPICKEG